MEAVLRFFATVIPYFYCIHFELDVEHGILATSTCRCSTSRTKTNSKKILTNSFVQSHKPLYHLNLAASCQPCSAERQAKSKDEIFSIHFSVAYPCFSSFFHLRLRSFFRREPTNSNAAEAFQDSGQTRLGDRWESLLLDCRDFPSRPSLPVESLVLVGFSLLLSLLFGLFFFVSVVVVAVVIIFVSTFFLFCTFVLRLLPFFCTSFLSWFLVPRHSVVMQFFPQASPSSLLLSDGRPRPGGATKASSSLTTCRHRRYRSAS